MSIIGLQKANCKNCYKCIKVCPVKSIRLASEQAQIIEADCILCGKCLNTCPQNAKTLSSDLDKVKGFLKNGKRVPDARSGIPHTGFSFHRTYSSGRLPTARHFRHGADGGRRGLRHG